MSPYDRPGRQQGDPQQEGYSTPTRQQGSPESTRHEQRGYGQEGQGGDLDWRREQGMGGRYRDEDAPYGEPRGTAYRINQPTGQGGYRGGVSGNRAPDESNYGYDTSHPASRSGGSGEWGQRQAGYQDFGQGDFNRGGYGGYGRGQREQELFDPDYHQWRQEQMNSLDDDYRQYRQDRYKKFSDEFSTWRNNRSQQQQGRSQQDKDKDKNK